MNDTSATIRSNVVLLKFVGRALPASCTTAGNARPTSDSTMLRAFTPSMQVTRGSSRSRACNWLWPTSTPTTLAAPRCSRQSVKPPVDCPTSRQQNPDTSSAVCASAPSSFKPPRETNLSISLASTSSATSSSNVTPGLVSGTRVCLRPTSVNTCPAAISRCAAVRDGARPRSTRSRSARMGLRQIFGFFPNGMMTAKSHEINPYSKPPSTAAQKPCTSNPPRSFPTIQNSKPFKTR